MAKANAQTTTDTDRLESAEGGLAATIGRILRLLSRKELSQWRPVMGLAVLLTLSAAILEVVSPIIFGNAINAVAGVGDGSLGLEAALWGMGLAIGLRFLAAALPQIRDILFAPASQDAQRLASVDAFGHAQRLSLGFHQTRRTGALSRVIDRAAQAIDYLIRFLAFNIGPTFVRLILASIALGIAYDPWLSVIAFGTILAYVMWTVIVTEWRVKQRRRMNVADTNLRGIAVDTLTNFETVKAFAAESRETKRYDSAMREYNARYTDAVRSMYLLNMGQAFFMNVGLLGVLALATWNAYTGKMLIGDVTAVYAILLSLYAPLNILGWAWREIKQGAVDLEKLHGLLDMTPDVADKPDAVSLKSPRGHVTFDGVGFTHDARAIGIQDISFEVQPGRSVAFVGTSGAGKSTLLKLLFRFY
ncbi:MAG: ABC transporter ATP-binding protein/permease, partial [Pseudomonadota bacterium]